MTPFFKLDPGWEKNQSFLIVGPDGLLSQQIIQTIVLYHKKAIRNALITSTQDCLELRESLATQSLFTEDEIWLIRVTKDNLLNSLNLAQASQHKHFIISGIEKKPTKCEWIKQLSLVIQSYALKEPYASKRVLEIANQYGITISHRSAKWIVLCYTGQEQLIETTIKLIAHIHGPNALTDEQIKPLLKHQGLYSITDLLTAFTQSKASLKMIVKRLSIQDWQSTYWMLVSYWRKLILAQQNPNDFKKHFPWKNQQTIANLILSQSTTQLTAQHHELLEMELALKGYHDADLTFLLTHWLYKYTIAKN